MATASARIGRTTISIEVAKDTVAIRKGLSGRDSLARNSGMLFIFPKAKKYRFWMRDMRFPIDTIWMRGGKVIGITENIPHQFDPAKPRFFKSPERADCVLEVPSGFIRQKRVAVGDQVVFTGIRPEFVVSAASKDDTDKDAWNRFVTDNQQIVGTFLETWEWGTFQDHLGYKAERYFVKEHGKIAAVFIISHHPLPGGLSYAYSPRGPFISKKYIDEEVQHFEILQAIKSWAKKSLPASVFLRLEPSVTTISEDYAMYGFHRPSYSIQPPHNTLVPLTISEAEILARFHSSTRSNIRRAERRGVTVEIKDAMSKDDLDHFFTMIKSTIERNNGKKAYPSEKYLQKFISTNRVIGKNDPYDRNGLSIGIFCSYQNGKPATTHIVVFCGDTATYLFGASNRESLSSKADTYLHWAGIQEAKRRGMRYYDLGGIDESLWPSLTVFKRQFGGDEFTYIGNIDVPIRPFLYRAYNLSRKIIKKIPFF